MQTQKYSKSELLGKLLSFREEFEREMLNMITSYSGKINQDVSDLVDEVCDLQKKLLATTQNYEELFVTVNELKHQNENLKKKLQVSDTHAEPVNQDQDSEQVDRDFQDVPLQQSEIGNDNEEEDEEIEQSSHHSCEGDFEWPTMQNYDQVREE